MEVYKVKSLDGKPFDAKLFLVDECPYCHKSIHPKFIDGYTDDSKNAQVILRCTNLDCQKIFIGFYHRDANVLTLKRVSIGTKKKIEIHETIIKISPDFEKIYLESNLAEQDNLFEICGAGYRKALEFLIKDYLIKLEPDKSTEIESSFLGKCIKTFVKNENIKIVAQRAAWLGNDEVHYVRIWEGDNLKNLKSLIELVMEWIKMEELTKKIKIDMLDPKEIKTEINENVLNDNSIEIKTEITP